jgi:alpha-galactosidase
MMKIVIIGAASDSFGRGTLVDILSCDDLKGQGVTLTLVDISEPGLEIMHNAAKRIAEHFDSDIAIEATTDRREALPGADFVIIAVSRRRFQLWEQDYRIPLSYGFTHVLGENGGPGALFHALRSFELIIPICRDIEALCPDAWVLNFTNPEARVLHAISHLTTVKAAGFCHGVFYGVQKIAEYLDQPEASLYVTSAGMNHFYCIMQCLDRETGEDLLPAALAKAKEENAPALQLFRKFAEIYDVFMFPSDDHIGEYVAFGNSYHGTQWPYGVESWTLAADETPAPDTLAEYAAGNRPIDDPWVLRPSGESVVPVICDIGLGRSNRHMAVNVLNREGYIDNLPRHSAVEVPGLADSKGIHPEHVGALPEAVATFIRPQLLIHDTLTEAYRTGSKQLLLQALLLDPLVNNVPAAETMLDQMLACQADFLPTFR